MTTYATPHAATGADRAEAPAEGGWLPLPAERTLFLITLALLLLAKGVALLPYGHSVDSYPKLIALSTNPTHSEGAFTEFLAQGRLGQWLLNQVLALLGNLGPGGNTWNIFISLCCFAAGAVFLCRLWRTAPTGFAAIALAGLFAIHPYHAEIFTFREAALTVSLAVLLALAGVTQAAAPRPRFAHACALLFAALNLYQVAWNYAFLALLIAGLLEWVRTPGAALLPRRDSPLTTAAAALAFTTIAYFAFFKLSVRFLTTPSGELARGALIPLSQATNRLRELARIFYSILLRPEPLMPTAIKWLLAAMLAAAVAVLLHRALAQPRRAADLLALPLVLGAALLGIAGIMIPIGGWMPVHRTLAAVSLLAAGSLAVLLACSPRLRGLALATAGVLLFAFGGVNNFALHDQFRLNQRDYATAVRMIERLEADPAFAPSRPLAVVGSLRHYPLRFFTSRDGSDVNVSALLQPWSKASLLREVSGYTLPDAAPADLATAKEYCQASAPWPAMGSVAMVQSVAVVCLPGQ
ncbi:MAG: glucosyltransferase domain-containing protein [Bryobacterales bacterium]|nr:glucosyltransferase domain-containing protein [Bryobacterales bacterium]